MTQQSIYDLESSGGLVVYCCRMSSTASPALLLKALVFGAQTETSGRQVSIFIVVAGLVLAAVLSWRRLSRKRYRKLTSKESNETPLEEIIVKHS